MKDLGLAIRMVVAAETCLPSAPKSRRAVPGRQEGPRNAPGGNELRKR
jgi:hypothetical protein